MAKTLSQSISSLESSNTSLSNSLSKCKTSIKNKGVSVPSTTRFSGLPALIDKIETVDEAKWSYYIIFDSRISENNFSTYLENDATHEKYYGTKESSYTWRYTGLKGGNYTAYYSNEDTAGDRFITFVGVGENSVGHRVNGTTLLILNQGTTDFEGIKLEYKNKSITLFKFPSYRNLHQYTQIHSYTGDIVADSIHPYTLTVKFSDKTLTKQFYLTNHNMVYAIFFSREAEWITNPITVEPGDWTPNDAD